MTTHSVRSIRPPTIDELISAAKFKTLEDIVAAAFGEMKPANRMSVTEAAKTFTRLGSGGGYSTPWSESRTPYLVEPQDVLTSLDYTGMIFVGPARTGKALPIDTDIPTPSGWRKMGDLAVGDLVFSSEGYATNITFATDVMYDRPCYKITFADGASIVADGDHLWEVRDILRQMNRPSQPSHWMRVVTTETLLKEGLTYGRNPRSRFAIKTPDPVCYPEQELPLDPYILGVWLGDGSKINGTISVGSEDLCSMQSQITSRGYRVRTYSPSQAHRCYTLAVMGPDGVFLDQYLSTMGFDEFTPKHIPSQYLIASAHQRRELLRGLMDTDGTIYGRQGRHVQFVSVDANLANQVRELAASLGYKASTRSKESYLNGVRHKDAHLVEFTVYDGSECFSLQRKAGRACATSVRRESQTSSRFIQSIEPVPSVPVRCIKVAAYDSLFLAGRDYIVTHNTVLGLNWLAHCVKTDPTDMLFVHMDRENARKWSNGDLNRFLAASTKIRSEQLTARQYDNTFDKTFKSGMRFLLTYPTAANLSGITVPKTFNIDYDRTADDIDGEGNGYDLTSMRTTTAKRFAMSAAESSPNPNKELRDPRWIPNSPHEAPPIRGIFELYNRGDRRRWQWCCPECEHWFEPDFKLLDWGGKTDPMEARDATVMICPHCGGVIERHRKDELNGGGRWIREGEMIEPGRDGRTVVRPGMVVTRSSIASFWLKGPAAGYQEWGQLVEKYLRALKALAETGDDGPLRKTVTTDQGTYYVPPSRLSDLSPDVLKEKAENWGDEPVVPRGVRFLVPTVDVQKTAFVVQVNGFTADGDHVIVDMFKVRLSNRLNERGERLPIDPAAFADDWNVLEDEVMNRTYPLDDASGRRMSVLATACDSGGAEGVTGHAYNFWRRLRQRQDGSHRKFILVKGEASRLKPLARTTWPDSSKKDKLAIARGDVPVLLFNSNSLKDRVSLLMSRRAADDSEDGGKLRFPHWAENWFYVQLTSEIRTDKGWENTRKRRNEAFDLSYYAQGIVLRPFERDVPFFHIGADRIDWSSPPAWAEEWDKNDHVTGGDATPEPPEKLSAADIFKKLGSNLG